MQSLEARSQYRNSIHCAYRIFTEEGVLRFWTGTTPRLVRLVVSELGAYARHLSEFCVGSSQVGSSSQRTKRLSPSSVVDRSGGYYRTLSCSTGPLDLHSTQYWTYSRMMMLAQIQCVGGFHSSDSRLIQGTAPFLPCPPPPSRTISSPRARLILGAVTALSAILILCLGLPPPTRT